VVTVEAAVAAVAAVEVLEDAVASAAAAEDVVAPRPRDPRRAEEWEDSPERRCRSIKGERMQQPFANSYRGRASLFSSFLFFVFLRSFFFAWSIGPHSIACFSKAPDWFSSWCSVRQ
jgi:hypothetical protein